MEHAASGPWPPVAFQEGRAQPRGDVGIGDDVCEHDVGAIWERIEAFGTRVAQASRVSRGNATHAQQVEDALVGIEERLRFRADEPEESGGTHKRQLKRPAAH